MAYRVFALVPAMASVSAQDRYVPHLSLRHLVTVFPVEIDRAQYVLVNADTYPWHDLPDVKLERNGETVTTVTAHGQQLRYRISAQQGPHLLLRRL